MIRPEAHAVTLDAIVIGAGLSGLVCARRLVEAGARIVVLEARDRVGGRLHTGRVGGAAVDLGGQWMTPGQHRLAALAAELGVATVAHERRGRVLIDEPARSWLAQMTGAFAQWRAMRRIERLTRGIPAGAPGDAREAAALDAMSLADWLARAVGHALARERIGIHAELVFASDPADLSLLHYLATLGASGGFVPDGARGVEHRFAGGAQQLAQRIAAGLGDVIRLGEPIEAIEDGASSVAVRGSRGSHQARHLVLAIPPVVARALVVSLPPPHRRYLDASRAGCVVKCFAAYARPFWRDAGWSGEQYRSGGTVRATVELAGEPPILLGFVVGREAERWAARDPAERRADVLAAFAQLGEATPLDYLEVDWGADPWSAGCVAAMPPGALGAGARWREPHGRIHFAGAETAIEWPGYMEGAIEAGERAAREVRAALELTTSSRDTSRAARSS